MRAHLGWHKVHTWSWLGQDRLPAPLTTQQGATVPTLHHCSDYLPHHSRLGSHRVAPLHIDRRTVLKATAAFVAMATAIPPASRTSAQSSSTLGAEWTQPDSVGGNSAELTFGTDFPFHAIAPHWNGNVDFPAAVEFSTSADGASFSDPVVVGPAHADAGPPDRDGRIFGELVFTEESNVVRYRGLDADGSTAAIPGLSFTYIDATGGPSLGDITTSTDTPSLTRPPIISRSEWGAELAYGGADRGASEWTPAYQTVRHAIIHHSETPSFRDPLAEIRSIHYYHAITRGWGDIGYNFLVDYLGNVYEGRTGGDNVIGGHAYQYARGSSGICSMGSFTENAATPEALAGLTWIAAWVARDLDPLGREDFFEKPNLPTICAHRDVWDSTCPGDGLYADMDSLRSAIADVISGARDIVVDPEFSPGQIVETIAEGVNARAVPGTSERVLSSLPLGAVLQVVEGPTTVDGYQWYEVWGDAGSGWVASEMVAASDAAPPVGKYAVGDDVLVNTDFLNIREEATLRGLVVATMPEGAPATVVEGPLPAVGYRWYRIESDYGTGWSVEQYIISPDEQKPETRFVVGDFVAVEDPDGVKLRAAPGTGASQIASLSPGIVGTVTDGPRLGDGYTWLQVQTADGTGWAAEPFFTASSTPPERESTFAVGDAVVVDTDSLRLRESPGLESEVIESLGQGVAGTIVGGPESASNLTWFQVETTTNTGWVADTFLAGADGDGSQPVPAVGNTVYVGTDGINLRSGPSTTDDVVIIVLRGETGTVVDGPEEADGYSWLKVEAGGGTGWGAAQYLRAGQGSSSNAQGFGVGDQVTIATDGINLRAAAGLENEMVKIVLRGTTGTIVDGPREADGYTWVRIQTDEGEGWGVDQYLQLESAAGFSTGDRARVIDGELNLRAEASTDAELVGVLPDGAFVDLLEGTDDNDGYRWYRVQTSRFGVGWVAADFLGEA